MTTTDITFPAAGGHPMRAALAVPEGDAKRPGVIVIHEIFGLNADIRRITGRVAELGYVALAPDLYDRPGARPMCVVRTMSALRRGSGQAFDDLDAARDFLERHPRADASRIAVVGFCMGGGFALASAMRKPMNVAATFYGEVPEDAQRLRGVCPVLGGYGAQDRIFAPQGRRLETILTQLGVEHDVKIYEAAGHSYMSQNRGFMAAVGAWSPMHAGYNHDAAEDSWKRIGAFFAKHLAQ